MKSNRIHTGRTTPRPDAPRPAAPRPAAAGDRRREFFRALHRLLARDLSAHTRGRD